MTELVRSMLGQALEALEEIMQERPEVVPQAASLLLVARYLECIADHVVNLADQAGYMKTGELAVLAPSHRSDYDTSGQPGSPG